MSAKYFALLTNAGAAKLANATALGTKFEITRMAVGDGGGVLPTPDPAQTALANELRRAPLNRLAIDPVNTSQIIAEQVIPEDAGGWWIREIGLFDGDGDMIAVANCAETYKPKVQEGSGRTQVIRMILTVSSTEAVTLKIDPSVVLATREYVDDAVIEVRAYADEVMKKHTDAANPHSQYPLIANALQEMADAGLRERVTANLGLGSAA
ncbi:phage tail protein, partial [Kosakonia cowanii]